MTRFVAGHGDMTTRCLLAVLSGATTVREVQAIVGAGSTETVHRNLRILRRNGLVDWADHRQGTLHPRVESVQPVM